VNLIWRDLLKKGARPTSLRRASVGG